ncbi:MAG TPA: saccharopine dehydrogenase NADP-binding domain-containing protein, partial [Natrialbaceae archaeon]|nr:saccharopine dehydrogenase NADP-binding domain-containing protein [Natrialbaceae archaeon]
MSLLVYGSYGYTGSLIAREAIDRGLSVTLAGRNRDRLREQSNDLGRPVEAVSLDDTDPLEGVVADHDAVMHCAGPFSETADPMVEACLAGGTDYLDITGEYTVLEAIAGRGAAAEAAGVTLLPAVGFDVVPSDCLAAHLADRLPSANHLALGIAVKGGPSPGTAKTAVEHLDVGGVVRRDGEIVTVPLGWRTRPIDFGEGVGTKSAAIIP